MMLAIRLLFACHAITLALHVVRLMLAYLVKVPTRESITLLLNFAAVIRDILILALKIVQHVRIHV